MIRGIVKSSIALRFLVLAIAATLLIVGVVQIRRMPVDVLPEFNPPAVEIQTEAPGLAPEEVEQFITVPMEHDLLNGTPWMQTIRSESAPGLSTIDLIFEPGTDLMRARQMVAERMTQAVALPHVSKPPTVLQPLSSSSRVMLVGLSSKSLSLIQMSTLARWTIAPRLSGIPGVAHVSIWGQRDWQLQVQVDPQKLKATNTPLMDVLETTANALWVSSLSWVEASTPGTGGFIESANQRLGIRHILPIVSADGLARVPIQDSRLKISDVAMVVEDNQPLIGDALTNGGASLLLVVEKFPGANTLDVSHSVEEALTAMGPGLAGIQTDTSLFRPVDFIEAAISNAGLAFLIGFLLVLLVLVAFFFNLRAVVISLVAIPLSLLAAVFVLFLRGATMNAVALAGLVMALGVVIDDAIIDVENAVRRLRQAREAGSARSPVSIIVESSAEIRSGIGFATALVLLTALPIFFIEGTSGAFVQPLAVSYTLAVLASMFVALVVTPALCVVLLANAPLERRGSPPGRWLRRGYEATLGRIVTHPRPVIVGLVAVILIGAAILPFSKLSFLPDFKQRDLLVQLNAAPGTSQPEMSRISGLISNDLRSVPGVRAVAAQVGRAVQGDQVVNVSSAELWVNMEPAADYDLTLAAIRKTLAYYPGIHHGVQTYLTRQSSAAASGPGRPIVVRVYGDAPELRSTAAAVQKALTRINGIVDPRVDLPVQQPTMNVETNMAAAGRWGIKPGDVRRAAATLFSGIMVGNLFEESKVFDVVVWSTPQTRKSISSIQDVIIDTPTGGHVRLGDVANVTVAPTESIIRHDATKRYIDVTANVQGRPVGAVAADVDNSLRQMQFPMEYHAELLGDYAQQQDAQNRLLILAIAVAIGVFFLLQAAFRSWRLAVVFFVCLPSALVGGVLAAAVAGGVWSLGSLAGLFAVFGIAARNGIQLVRHFQHRQQAVGNELGPRLTIQGAGERCLPIVMTALATGLALAPALVLGDKLGLEFIRPMAVAVVGGLVTSTLFNLFVLPTLYLALKISPAPELDLAPVEMGISGGALGGTPEASPAGGE